MKVSVYLLLCVMTIGLCAYWAFETGKVWEVRGYQSFDNFSDTIAFVTYLENLETTNLAVYKRIELSGLGTRVDYVLDFQTKPGLPEGQQVGSPRRVANTQSWHFLGSAVIAAVVVFILFVIYGATEPSTDSLIG